MAFSDLINRQTNQTTETPCMPEAYWALDAKGDSDGFISYFDDDYLGWGIENPLPSSKTEVDKYIRYGHKNDKVLFYHLKPVAIKIYGDIAFAHYYYSLIRQDAAGKKTDVNGRWTDILKKNGGKWLLIGDSGGRTNKDEAD